MYYYLGQCKIQHGSPVVDVLLSGGGARYSRVALYQRYHYLGQYKIQHGSPVADVLLSGTVQDTAWWPYSRYIIIWDSTRYSMIAQ
jgi:hypothetical protein